MASIFKDFNRVSVFHDRFWISNEDIQLFTDSAGVIILALGLFLRESGHMGLGPVHGST